MISHDHHMVCNGWRMVSLCVPYDFVVSVRFPMVSIWLLYVFDVMSHDFHLISHSHVMSDDCHMVAPCLHMFFGIYHVNSMVIVQFVILFSYEFRFFPYDGFASSHDFLRFRRSSWLLHMISDGSAYHAAMFSYNFILFPYHFFGFPNTCLVFPCEVPARAPPWRAFCEIKARVYP